MMRLLGACVTVLLCLAVGSCGDKSDSDADKPKADAGKDSGLGVKRFDALDRMFVAAVALDKYVEQDAEQFSLAKFREDAKPLERACDELPGSDDLMRAMRTGCRVLQELTGRGAAFGTCESNEACRRSTRALRRFFQRAATLSRRGDRVVAAEKGLAEDCKQALATPPKSYAVYASFDEGLALLQRALRSPSPEALTRAQERLAAADEGSKGLPSGKELLERFRSGCD